MESARPALATDAARLAELGRMARAELRTERGGSVLLARELARPDALTPAIDGHRTWVGTLDDVVLGYLVARVEAIAEGGRLGVIDEIYVEPGGRQVGLGEAMLDLALAWFADEGCAGVDAYALPGMRDTKNFFELFGFTARLLVVHHRLVGQGDEQT